MNRIVVVRPNLGFLLVIWLAVTTLVTGAQVDYHVAQTLVFHQRSAFPSHHRLEGMHPSISDNGETIVFRYRIRDVNQPKEEDDYPVFAMNFDGSNVRDWLHVDDHARALYLVATKGQRGETYNIGGKNEKTNLEVVETICDLLAAKSASEPQHTFAFALCECADWPVSITKFGCSQQRFMSKKSHELKPFTVT